MRRRLLVRGRGSASAAAHAWSASQPASPTVYPLFNRALPRYPPRLQTSGRRLVVCVMRPGHPWGYAVRRRVPRVRRGIAPHVPHKNCSPDAVLGSTISTCLVRTTAPSDATPRSSPHLKAVRVGIILPGLGRVLDSDPSVLGPSSMVFLPLQPTSSSSPPTSLAPQLVSDAPLTLCSRARITLSAAAARSSSA